MVRSTVLAMFLAPALVALVWGDTVALFVGVAGDGVQARYYPPPRSEPGDLDVRILETAQVVPSAGLPRGLQVQTSNNNLDAVRHSDGRVYLAFRTAPDHFAGKHTVIAVVSSSDERQWQLETRIALQTDLREPRLLSLGDKLFLYVSQLGKDRWAFEPHGVLVTERRADGSWSDIEPLGLPGYIAWRTRIEDGSAYMTAYLGGASIYRFDGKPLHVDLLRSDDGRHWEPVDPQRRSVYVGGGSEADFTLDQSGKLFAVIRNESGDESGFGSKICSAAPGQLAHWRCRSDKRKFDSPYMFRMRGEIYLLARRNVTRDGLYDHVGPTQLFKSVRNQLSYVTTGKRCALWRVDRSRDRIVFVKDLPSRGDTCFPAVVPTTDPDRIAVYNYSSPIDGADVPWSVGQRRPTYIYRHVLSFSPRSD